MVLRIKKRSQAEWLVMYIFTLPFAFSFFIDILSFPTVIKYTIDVALAVLLCLIAVNRISMPNEESKKLLRVVMFFIAGTVLGAMINFVSPINYLWGFRNNIRLYVFFFACILFLKESNIPSYLGILDGFFWINLIVTLFQFFVLKKRQDNLGGIFGVQKGCNAYTNIFFLIVIAKSILFYVNRKESLLRCLCKCAIALLIAAMAEIKILFIEIIIILVMVFLHERFSVRKIMVILGSVIGIVVAVELLSFLTPNFAGWFNLKSIVETASSEAGYTMQNDMNRLTAITMSLERFLTSWSNKLFGLGLGNCDYSTAFDFLTTPFYKAHKGLHYVWFSSAFIILETGIVGLITYLFFFVCVWRYTSKCKEKNAEKNIYFQMSRIMSIMSIVMFFYNSAMRTEAGYMMFFILSLPFVQKSSGYKEVKLHTVQEIENGGIQ